MRNLYRLIEMRFVVLFCHKQRSWNEHEHVLTLDGAAEGRWLLAHWSDCAPSIAHASDSAQCDRGESFCPRRSWFRLVLRFLTF